MLGSILAIAGVAAIQQLLISAANFGGTDEWLYLDLSSRGVLGIPYANRPLVLFWHALPARLWPGSLAAFWAFAGAYRLGTGLLTAALAWRLTAGRGRLALLAGACAVAWTPLDRLRLDTVLICGYEGVTFATTAVLLLWLESWRRRSPAMLVAAAVLGVTAALGVESVVPVLAVAPALMFGEVAGSRRRAAAWVLAWEAVVLLAALHAALPLLTGRVSYQTSGLGLDPAPPRVVARLLQLLGMQLLPLFQVGRRDLTLAAGAGALVWTAACALGRPSRDPAQRERSSPLPVLRMLGVGLLLAVAGHAALALTPQIVNPARTQILPGPGFALAVAAAIDLPGRLVGRRSRWLAPAVAGAWIVGLGTARVQGMQAEWDGFRSSFRAQAATLSSLTEVAPAFRAGTLVLLLDPGPAWPMTFTFRHALRYLYGEGVVGVVQGANDFLYPWGLVANGVWVDPWPVLRREWQVAPSLNTWQTVVVVSRDPAGAVTILPQWPRDRLPALPPGAGYDPAGRVLPTPVCERERRVLAGWRLLAPR